MDRPIRQPEEILAYRPLEQILASKPQALWSVGPAETVPAAVRIMADRNIGFLLVLDHGKLVTAGPVAALTSAARELDLRLSRVLNDTGVPPARARSAPGSVGFRVR